VLFCIQSPTELERDVSLGCAEWVGINWSGRSNLVLTKFERASAVTEYFSFIKRNPA